MSVQRATIAKSSNNMLHKNYLFLLVALLGASSLFCQTTPTTPAPKGNKGKFYFFWGYNRGYYTHSDLHLHGDNYDFTLYDVVAKDRQTPFAADVYLNPAKLTIPQCNYGIGYYINDHYSVSINVDHMKYVMVQDQTVKITGSIANSNTNYDGSYDRDDIVLKDDFLLFEHTDGLNYIVAEFTRTDNLLPLVTHYKGGKVAVNLHEGVGIGGLYPRTNATLLSNPRNDAFHLSGYGASLKVGLDITLFHHFFIGGNLKGGFIHMPSVRTTASSSDRGSQKFGFFEDNFVLGWRF